MEELAQLVGEFTRLVKGLIKLGEPVDKWDISLTHLLYLKLDESTILTWEATCHEKDEYSKLMEFLNNRMLMSSHQLTPSTSHSAKL